MKRLSQIMESVFDDIIKRSKDTEIIKKEDDHKFRKALKALEDADEQFVKFYDTLWAPFNFGSENTNEPGFFMGEEELEGLKEYLKDTDYDIPDAYEWHKLVSDNKFEVTKAGKYWSLFIIRDGKQFYLPQFGYISGASTNGEISGLLKNNGMYYAFQYLKYFGYQYITKMGGQPENMTYMFKTGVNDKVQVRLIKRHK